MSYQEVCFSKFWRIKILFFFQIEIHSEGHPMVTCLEDGSVTSQITNQSFVLPDASEQKTEASFPLISMIVFRWKYVYFLD